MNNNPNSKREYIIKDGIATEALPGATFNVEVEGKTIIAHLSGKMRIHHIRVYPGDKVSVRISEDGGRGIIMRRL